MNIAYSGFLFESAEYLGRDTLPPEFRANVEVKEVAPLAREVAPRRHHRKYGHKPVPNDLTAQNRHNADQRAAGELLFKVLAGVWRKLLGHGRAARFAKIFQPKRHQLDDVAWPDKTVCYVGHVRPFFTQKTKVASSNKPRRNCRIFLSPTLDRSRS